MGYLRQDVHWYVERTAVSQDINVNAVLLPVLLFDVLAACCGCLGVELLSALGVWLVVLLLPAPPPAESATTVIAGPVLVSLCRFNKSPVTTLFCCEDNDGVVSLVLLLLLPAGFSPLTPTSISPVCLPSFLSLSSPSSFL